MSQKIRKVRFVVPGKPVGFKTTTTGGKWNRDYGKYVDYKRVVERCAIRAGISLPLVATKDRPLTIRTISYFKDGRHPDPGNVQKGICDALFYNKNKKGKRRTGKGDDKYTGGSFPPPRYDKENPRVVVIIKDYVRKKKGKNNGKRRNAAKDPGKRI